MEDEGIFQRESLRISKFNGFEIKPKWIRNRENADIFADVEYNNARNMNKYSRNEII